MPQLIIDTLALANRLTAGGFTGDQAAAMADALAGLTKEDPATADDIRSAQETIMRSGASLEQSLEEVRESVEERLSGLAGSVQGTIDRVEAAGSEQAHRLDDLASRVAAELTAARADISRTMDEARNALTESISDESGKSRDTLERSGERLAEISTQTVNAITAMKTGVDSRFEQLEATVLGRLEALESAVNAGPKAEDMADLLDRIDDTRSSLVNWMVGAGLVFGILVVAGVLLGQQFVPALMAG